jgi:hypothetical protein
MAIPKIIGAQRDFSAGELDESIKRADENPVMKTGARQMSNWRILSSRAVQNRPGRTALFPIPLTPARVERITMAPGQDFYLAFAAARIGVYNASLLPGLVFTMQPALRFLPVRCGATVCQFRGLPIISIR